MATCAQADDDGLLKMLVLACVMHAATVPVLVLALLARNVFGLSARRSNSDEIFDCEMRDGEIRDCEIRSNSAVVRGARVRASDSGQPPPLTMHAAVCSALGRRLSKSDSALLDAMSTRPPPPRLPPPRPPPPRLRTSPVFARMLANTREAPARPRRSLKSI